MKASIALIGPGKVGCAISRRLQVAGYPVAAVVSRDQGRAAAACQFIGCSEQLASTDVRAAVAADILLLAVPDDQIQSLATEIQQRKTLSSKKVLVHFSGLHPAVLMRHEQSAAQLLSLHPLLPFASRELAAEKLSGCPCAVEGDTSARALGEELIRAVGGTPFHIPAEQKPLYHAAACIASNYLVTLLDCATELFSRCGIDKQAATLLLQPLLQATLKNCTELNLEQGLTGPIVRGDSGTVETHLATLKSLAPELLDLYRALGKRTLNLAVRSERLPPGQAVSISDLLD